MNGTTDELTCCRRELKYHLTPMMAASVRDRLSRFIPPKIVKGTAVSYRASIYMDTVERRFAQAALAQHLPPVRVRLRDYYTLKNPRTPRFGPACFFEVKVRIDDWVKKSRYALSRDALRLLDASKPIPVTCPIDQPIYDVFKDVGNMEPLQPLFWVHYRRYTLENSVGTLRVTFDDRVRYHYQLDSLDLSRHRGLHLTLAQYVEPMWIVEIKSVGDLPAWLMDRFHGMSRAADSKFATGVRVLNDQGRLFK